MSNLSSDTIRISNDRRYTALVRCLDGSDIRVYSAAINGRCSYGTQHWFDVNLDDYGQVGLDSPFYFLHSVAEMTEAEAEEVDSLLGL